MPGLHPRLPGALAVPLQEAENRKVLAAKPEPCPSSLPLHPLVQVQAWGHLRAGVGLSRGLWSLGRCVWGGDRAGCRPQSWVSSVASSVPRAGGITCLYVAGCIYVHMCIVLCDRCSCTMSPGSGPGVFWGGVCVTSPPHLDHGGWRVNGTGAWLFPGVWRGGRGEEQGKH